MEKHKEVTRDYYDKNALLYQSRVSDYIEGHLSREIELFIKTLQGKRILDLGSGSGRDSLFFWNRGFEPVCVDISHSMIKLCQEKGLVSCVMDIESIGFKEQSFDGIWAYTSLLHIQKSNINQVLLTINRLLKDNGVFFIGMKEGDFEGYHKNPLYECERFSSLYKDEEFKGILSQYFNILFSSKTKLQVETYLNYLCKSI